MKVGERLESISEILRRQGGRPVGGIYEFGFNGGLNRWQVGEDSLGRVVVTKVFCPYGDGSFAIVARAKCMPDGTRIAWGSSCLENLRAARTVEPRLIEMPEDLFGDEPEQIQAANLLLQELIEAQDQARRKHNRSETC